MKIREIISEAPIPTKALGALALKGKQWLLSGAEKEAAIKRIATSLADDLLRSGEKVVNNLSKTKVLKQLSDAEKNFIRDPSFVKNIAATAAKIAAQTRRARVVANVKGLVTNPKIGQLVSAGIVITPVVEYFNNTNAWQDKLEAGEITEAEYEQHRREEASKLVATLAAQMAAQVAAKKISNTVRLLAGWIPGVNAVLSTMTPAASKGFALWLGTDDGQQWMAKLALSVFPDWVVKNFEDIVGSGATKLIDYLKSKLPEFMQIGLSTSQGADVKSAQSAQPQGGKPNSAAGTTDYPQPADLGKQVGMSIKRGPASPDRPYNVTIGSD